MDMTKGGINNDDIILATPHSSKWSDLQPNKSQVLPCQNNNGCNIGQICW